MPSLPTNGLQLIVLLIFLLPGVVYQFVRTRLRGPVPDDASALTRVLRAVGISVGLVSIYAALLGPYLLLVLGETQRAAQVGQIANVRELGVLAGLLLFVIPAGLAGLDYLRRTKVSTNVLHLSYNPSFPTAWDFAFTARSECFVRVLTEDGRWAGGLLGENSWMTSYPEPQEIFVEIAYRIQDDGTFLDAIPGSEGMYIRCETAVLVEFVAIPQPPAAGGTPGTVTP